MSCEPYLLHNTIDGVFLPRSPVPQRFCLPRFRGVPTSFYKLNMMFLTNRGTPEYYFPYTQIRAVTHIYIYISFIFPQRPWNRTILRHYFLDFDEYPSTAKVARQAQRGDTRCTRHLPGSRPQGYPHCLPEFPAMAMGRFLLKTHTVFGTVWQAMDFCTWFRKNMHLKKKQQQQNSSACFSKFLTRIYAATN